MPPRFPLSHRTPSPGRGEVCEATEDRSDKEWIVEIERRVHAALSGEPGISWEDARVEIRHRLASQ